MDCPQTANNIYLDAATIDNIQANRILAQKKNQTMLDNHQIFLGAVGLTGVIWLINAVEAAINFPEYNYGFSVNTPDNTLHGITNEPRLSLTYNF